MITIHRKRLKLNMDSRNRIIKGRFYNDVLLANIAICLYIELLKCFTGIALVINFIPDALNLCTFMFMMQDAVTVRAKITRKLSNILILLFLVWVFATGLFPVGGLADRYRRCRYIFFGVIAYYACMRYMTKEYWKRILGFLYISQIINTVLVTYQFAVMHTSVDMTNGIFGFLEYNNASHGLFCLIMSMTGMEGFLKKNMSEKKAVSIILMSCYTCALAEIKAFYVLFVVGAIFVMLLNSKNSSTLKRALILIFIGMIGLSAAVLILLKIMPENLYAFMGADQWAAYESYETGRAAGMGRTTQLQYLYTQSFQNSPVSAFIGAGLGADTALIPYELGKIFLNFGFLGLGLFVAFLLTKAAELYKNRKNLPESMISMVICILTIPCMVVWNTTLNRMALLLFVILALGSADCFKRNHDCPIGISVPKKHEMHHGFL